MFYILLFHLECVLYILHDLFTGFFFIKLKMYSYLGTTVFLCTGLRYNINYPQMINHDVIDAESALFFLGDESHESVIWFTGILIFFLSTSCPVITHTFVLYNRSSLQPTWAVNSQLQGTSAHHFPRLPAPRPPPPRTSPTQPTRLSLWGLVKALWAQSPRGLDTPQPRTALLSGQDPQAHARSAYSTSRLQQPQFQCTKATTWGPHKPPRHQWTLEGPTLGLRSPVSPGPGWDRGPHRAESADSREPLAPFAG